MSVVPKHKGQKVYEIYSPGIASAGTREDSLRVPPVPGSERDPIKGVWDVIIIGTGMGGMSCGAALAKMGKRVLMLEQHYLPGGFTHSFARKGWHWDAGVHAIGEMTEGDIPRAFLDWLTDGKVEMVSLGNPYDRFRFFDGLTIEFADTRAAYIANMKRLFPEQSPALDRYFEVVEKAAKASMAFFGLKTLPEKADRIGSRVVSALLRDWWSVTTEQVLDECGIEGKLRTALTVHWGYYGSIPKESAFAVHALTHTHFWNGAYYPRGGSKVFAEALLGQVLDAGGKVLCRAAVDTLLLEEGRAVGVRMEDGHTLRAPIVVSAAGAKTTVTKLLPEPQASSPWAKTIKALKDSPSYLCLNLGFEGDIGKLGASAANLWLFETYERDQKVWDVSDPDSVPHILYLSFPSLKDPDHDPGPKGRHTGECVTFLDWGLFEKWGDKPEKREEAYLELKRSIEQRLLAHLRTRLPELMQKLAYSELSTPLTALNFTRASQGAIYGLEATPERFTCKALRTRTPIKGFYMTGVDIASLGVVGAMTSGMLTAATIEPKLYGRLLFPQRGMDELRARRSG